MTSITGLQKHMEGLTNDVERSNETVFTSFSFSHYLLFKVQ